MLISLKSIQIPVEEKIICGRMRPAVFRSCHPHSSHGCNVIQRGGRHGRSSGSLLEKRLKIMVPQLSVARRIGQSRVGGHQP